MPGWLPSTMSCSISPPNSHEIIPIDGVADPRIRLMHMIFEFMAQSGVHAIDLIWPSLPYSGILHDAQPFPLRIQE